MDIICLSLFRTDNPYSSVSLRLCKALAKNHRVFYINHPHSLRDVISDINNPEVRKKIRRFLAGKPQFEMLAEIPDNFISVTPPVTLAINFLDEGPLYDRLRKFNNQILRRTLEAVIEKYQIRDYIYYNCFNPFFEGCLSPEHPPVITIYQCIDDISQDEYTSKHGIRLEAEAIANADLALVTSTELKNKYEPITKNIYCLHNAVELATFSKALSDNIEKPAELAHVHGKVIGFIGNLDHLRINYPLIKKVALAHPDKTLLLVGPINNTEYKDIGLHKLGNVIFTGSRSHNDLPKYLKYMDCAIIPFLCNTLTKSIYPLKINEYLAAGKGVVSTNFSEDIRGFKDVIYLAENDDQFIALIDQAIKEDCAALIQKRVQIAKTNNWEARESQFWQILEKYLVPEFSNKHPSF